MAMGPRESMKARERMHRDRGAVGGFQESLVAMMVVAAGVTMLAAAMALLPAGGADVVDPSRTVMERLVTDERWTVAPGVLHHDDIDEISIELSDVGGVGVRVVLQEINGPTTVLLESGETGSGERYASSRPVNVHYGPQQVAAATLTVWVWT